MIEWIRTYWPLFKTAAGLNRQNKQLLWAGLIMFYALVFGLIFIPRCSA